MVIGVPGRSNLGGRHPVARKNFLLIFKKKTSKIRQKNAKNSGILPEFLAFCPNFFKTGGAAAPPAPLANTPMLMVHLVLISVILLLNYPFHLCSSYDITEVETVSLKAVMSLQMPKNGQQLTDAQSL